MLRKLTSATSLKLSSWQYGGWVFWSIAALFYAYEFLHRVSPSVMTHELRHAFHINEQQLGTLGALYFYAYAAFQLPAGILIDRYGAKCLLLLASIVLTLGSFLFTITHSIEVAYLSRLMIGAGSAFAFVGCLKIGARWLTMRSFPLVVGLTNLWGTLGALSGGTPLSYLIQHQGWRGSLFYLSLAGLLITLLIAFCIPGSEREKPAKKAISPPLFVGLKKVASTPQSWLLALYAALLVSPIVALPEMWGVEFLSIAYDMSPTTAASFTHTIFIGTAIGGPLLGWLATYVENKYRLMVIATCLAATLLLILVLAPKLPQLYLYGLLLFYGLLTANMLYCFSFITFLHPRWAQGAAIGFVNMIVMASGGIAQHAIGWVLNAKSSSSMLSLQDYQIALSVLPSCLFIAAILPFFLSQRASIKGKEYAV